MSRVVSFPGEGRGSGGMRPGRHRAWRISDFRKVVYWTKVQYPTVSGKFCAGLFNRLTEAAASGWYHEARMPSCLTLSVFSTAAITPAGTLVFSLTQVLGILAVFSVILLLVLLNCQRRMRTQMETKLRENETAARESQQRWELLFEQSPLSVQIFRPDGQCVRFNNAWRELFRLSDEQGLAFNVLKDPDLNASGAVNLIRKAFAGEVVVVPPVSFPVNTDPPEHRWIGGLLYPVKDASGKITEVVTVHRDITETVRAEEAMKNLNQTLERKVKERTAELEAARAELAKALEAEKELGELKTRFVGMVSHEFRTPLAVIMSAVEIMRYFHETITPEKHRELYDDIHGATRDMGALMEEVLELGRMESAGTSFRPVMLNLEALLGKIIDETHSATQGKCRIRLEWESEPDGFADESLLRRIFGNVINNAVKYSPADAEVLVTARREGEDLVCEVRDRGIGIPEKDLPRLFDAFHRCENAGDIPGTGLGLVIVKRCVGMHQGTLDVESREGEGTTFRVRLPVFADLVRPGASASLAAASI